MRLRLPFRVFSNRSIRIAILVACGTVIVLLVLFLKIRNSAKPQEVQLPYQIDNTQQRESKKAEVLSQDVQLPYLNDSESQTILKQMLESGEMLELARTVNVNSEALTEHYPNLTLNGNTFWTLGGRSLNIADMLNIVLNRSEHQPIPNVIHMFMFSNTGSAPMLSFHAYLSFLSAFWLSGVDMFILWCNVYPEGHYWTMLRRNVTNHGAQDRLIIAYQPLPTRVFNRPVKVMQHQYDLMKLQTAILMGGIFLDSDSVTLRSLQPLRRHDCAIGRETSDGLSIGTLMSKPSSRFVLIWYMLYQTFKDEELATHSTLLPEQIWRRFPSLCHVENDTMTRPNWLEPELSMLYKKFNQLSDRWNWDRNYMVHLWNYSGLSHNEVSVMTVDSMFGEVARHVLYGTKDIVLC